MSTAVSSHRLKSQDAIELLSQMYDNNAVPNMFEYLMRCPICAAMSPQKHNAIREGKNKEPVPVEPRPFNSRKYPVY